MADDFRAQSGSKAQPTIGTFQPDLESDSVRYLRFRFADHLLFSPLWFMGPKRMKNP